MQLIKQGKGQGHTGGSGPEPSVAQSEAGSREEEEPWRTVGSREPRVFEGKDGEMKSRFKVCDKQKSEQE